MFRLDTEIDIAELEELSRRLARGFPNAMRQAAEELQRYEVEAFEQKSGGGTSPAGVKWQKLGDWAKPIDQANIMKGRGTEPGRLLTALRSANAVEAGGYEGSVSINVEYAADHQLGLGVSPQRILLEIPPQATINKLARILLRRIMP